MAQNAYRSYGVVDRCVIVFLNIKFKNSNTNRSVDFKIIKNLGPPSENKLLIAIDRVQHLLMLTIVLGVNFGYIPLNVLRYEHHTTLMDMFLLDNILLLCLKSNNQVHDVKKV